MRKQRVPLSTNRRGGTVQTCKPGIRSMKEFGGAETQISGDETQLNSCCCV